MVGSSTSWSVNHTTPGRIQGNPQDEWRQREKTHRAGLDGAKSARERVRERERDRPDQECAAESGTYFYLSP